jgi:hypothetical protein
MLEGSCHCGAVTWRFEASPGGATSCNCTVCRRYGALWIYGHEGIDVSATGTTNTYMRGEAGLAFHFCAACGCVAYWRSISVGQDGRRRMAVNVRLADPKRWLASPSTTSTVSILSPTWRAMVARSGICGSRAVKKGAEAPFSFPGAPSPKRSCRRRLRPALRSRRRPWRHPPWRA